MPKKRKDRVKVLETINPDISNDDDDSDDKLKDFIDINSQDTNLMLGNYS